MSRGGRTARRDEDSRQSRTPIHRCLQQSAPFVPSHLIRNVRMAGGQSCPPKRAGRAARRKRRGGVLVRPVWRGTRLRTPSPQANRHKGSMDRGGRIRIVWPQNPTLPRLRRPAAPEQPQEGRNPSGSIVAKERERFTQACTWHHHSSCRTCRNRPLSPRCFPFT